VRQQQGQTVDAVRVSRIVAANPPAVRRKGAGAAGTHVEGLRHTAATILRETNYDFTQIAEFLGQKTEIMAKHDCRADRSMHMTAMVKDFDREVNKRRQKLSNLPEKVSNRDGGE
jgi:integrase